MNVPEADVKFIGKLLSYYFKTADGKHTALTYLNAKTVPASAMQTYYRSGGLGDDTKKIKPSDLLSFRGWIYQGYQSVPFEAIDVEDREDSMMCDNCGGRYPMDYCVKPVDYIRPNGGPRTEVWCNHCRYLHDDPKIKSTGDQRKCTACEKVACEFHPRHVTLGLPPPKSADIPLPPQWERL